MIRIGSCWHCSALRHARHQLIVLQVLDRAEMELPFGRPVTFEDMETGAKMQIDPKAIREDYRREMAAFLENLKKAVRAESDGLRAGVYGCALGGAGQGGAQTHQRGLKSGSNCHETTPKHGQKVAKRWPKVRQNHALFGVSDRP